MCTFVNHSFKHLQLCHSKKPIVDFFHNNYVPDSISLGYIKYQKLLSKISNVERLFSLFMTFCKDRNLLDDFFTYIQSKGYYLDTLSPFTVYETTNKQDIDYDEKAKSGDYINLDESSFVENCLFVYDSHHTDGLPAIGNINGQPIVRLKDFVIAHKSKFSKETLDKLENMKPDETI